MKALDTVSNIFIGLNLQKKKNQNNVAGSPSIRYAKLINSLKKVLRNGQVI